MIVEVVGGETDMGTLAATEDTTDVEVVDGKASLEGSKMLAERLLLVRRVLPESSGMLSKRAKRKLDENRKKQSLRANVLAK